MSRFRVAFTAALLAFSVAAAACKGADHPRTPPVSPLTVTLAAAPLGGVASDGTSLAVAYQDRLELRRGEAVVWERTVAASLGRVALAPAHVYVAARGTGTLLEAPVRGEPAAAVLALDRASGAPRWKILLESNDWVTIADMAALPDGGAIVVGSYAGSLRAGATAIGAGDHADGFLLALTSAGAVRWLRRMGGTGSDAVQAVAVRGSDIAIAGTYQNTAEVGGVELPSFDERTPNPDGFVALLDENGARRWAQVFGGAMLETVAGVAIDARGRVVVAASVRGEVSVSGRTLTAQGPGDGLVAWWENDGRPHIATLVGGEGIEVLRGIAPVDDRVVIGGVRGDTGFFAAYDGNGAQLATWDVDDAAPSEIVALGGVPGGFVVGYATATIKKALVRPIPPPASN